MLPLSVLLALAALAYGCVTWHGTLLCVFIVVVLVAAGVFLFALLRELWTLHQIKYM
ncbi:MAG: hypothetical protein OEW79_12570 [Betaproteobacteria bacterium]|nr:hypothetical protein [Betaproteobacteria bacterium]MDH4293586.1 hypothetical protein [Betaproteobacteria bacterium]MDH5343651.1 hypothetical protein [Betaproteobacteria bacterium]